MNLAARSLQTHFRQFYKEEFVEDRRVKEKALLSRPHDYRRLPQGQRDPPERALGLSGLSLLLSLCCNTKTGLPQGRNLSPPHGWHCALHKGNWFSGELQCIMQNKKEKRLTSGTKRLRLHDTGAHLLNPLCGRLPIIAFSL